MNLHEQKEIYNDIISHYIQTPPGKRLQYLGQMINELRKQMKWDKHE